MVLLNRFLDCEACDFTFPAIDNRQDCTTFLPPDSQISDLVIVPIGAADPFLWTGASPVYVPGTIDNTTISLAYAKRLVGEGSVQPPEKNISILPRNRRSVERRVFDLVFRVRSLEDWQYEFCKRFQQNWSGFRFYFLTIGGRLVGPAGGMRPLFTDSDLPLDSGRESKEYADIMIRWEADGDAPRFDATLSDGVVGEQTVDEFTECPACDFCFPPIINQLDCTNYPQRDSQICEIVVVPLTAPDPFDWTGDDPELIDNSIDNSETAMAKAKRIVGEGGVAVPEKNVVVLPRNRQNVERRVFTLTHRVRNTQGNQFDFIRQFQCNWRMFRFYYLTNGGRMFGPQGGIKPLFVDADLPLLGGRGDKEYFDLMITWEDLGDPRRWNYLINDFRVGIIPNVFGDESTGEVWGDETTGEVWGWQ